MAKGTTTAATAPAAPAAGQPKTYEWREGAPYSDDKKAQAVGAELAAIEAANHGCTDLDDRIVAAARNPKSALHDHFEWNNTAAAEQYRRRQAGHLRRCVVVIIAPATKTTGPVRVSIFTSTTKYGSHVAGSFFQTDDGLKNPTQRQHLIQRALSEAQAFVNKWQILAGTRGPIGTILRVMKKALAIVAKRTKKKKVKKKPKGK